MGSIEWRESEEGTNLLAHIRQQVPKPNQNGLSQQYFPSSISVTSAMSSKRELPPHPDSARNSVFQDIPMSTASEVGGAPLSTIGSYFSADGDYTLGGEIFHW